MNKPGHLLLSIGEAAAALGVAVATLRRRHRQGRLLPAGRTLGGHRRYEADCVRAKTGAATAAAGKTICYARVSSHDQSAQLLTQAARLERHCHEAGFAQVEVVTDLGSGLNYHKKGLQRYGQLYGTLKRKLYARVAAGGGKAMAYKTEFCRTHGIPARLFNQGQARAQA